MLNDEIIGVWQLVSCEGKSSDGQSFLPYGANPKGKLIYTQDGHMSVVLMDPTRPRFRSEDISQASADEIVSAFRGFDAYSGTWTIQPFSRVSSAQVENARVATLSNFAKKSLSVSQWIQHRFFAPVLRITTHLVNLAKKLLLRPVVDDRAGKIEHLIEVGRIPNWVGAIHPRSIAISEGLLTLTTDEFAMGGKTWRVYVSWRRCSGD